MAFPAEEDLIPILNRKPAVCCTRFCRKFILTFCILTPV